MSDTFEVQIAICPECDGDMLESMQLDESLDQRIRQDMGDKLGDDTFQYDYHLCPKCKVIVVDGDEHEARTEYRQLFNHADEGGTELVEIRVSDNPAMLTPTTNWYIWNEVQPTITTDYTGVDAAFDEIMSQPTDGKSGAGE